MRPAAALAALGAVFAACGGPGPSLSMSFALGDVRAKQLQVVFVRTTGASVDCTSIANRCIKDVVSEPERLLGPEGFEGRRSLLVGVDPASASSGTQALRPEVPGGTYLVAVEAINEQSKLVAQACSLSVVLRSGETTPLRLVLQTLAGCDAGAPCDCEPAYP